MGRMLQRQPQQQQQQHIQPRAQTSDPELMIHATSSPKRGSEASARAPDQFVASPVASRQSAPDATRGRGSRRCVTALSTDLDVAGTQLPVVLSPRSCKRQSALRRPWEFHGNGDSSTTSRHTSMIVDNPMVKPDGPQPAVTGAKASGAKGHHVADAKDYGNDYPHLSRLLTGTGSTFSFDSEADLGPNLAKQDRFVQSASQTF